MNRNNDLMVEVPAQLLYNLESLAGGYTMSRGGWLNPRALREEAYWILYEAGYESYDDEMLPGAGDWKVR